MHVQYFIIGICILEFVAGLAIYSVYSKRLKFAVEKHNLDLNEHKNNWLIEKRKLEAEIDARSAELSSLSLHYIQKIEQVNELRQNLERFKKSVPKELTQKFHRLIDDANSFESVDQEWNNFRTYFNDVNFGFFDHLKAHYPSLSAKDLKLCALLRLNLETRQIANIMGVSPESAKVTRHRIRKKLGLSVKDNLHDFLNRISTSN